MKRKTAVLIILILSSVMMLGIVCAQAYFTTYVEVKGARTIRLGDETTIEEKYEPWKKEIRISSSKDSAKPVYIRAAAFSGIEYQLIYESPEKTWTDGGDGFWYYQNPVLPGGTTDTLIVSVKDKETGEDPKVDPERAIDIVVVYESTPAVENGTDQKGNTLYLPADWSTNPGATEGGGKS